MKDYRYITFFGNAHDGEHESNTEWLCSISTDRLLVAMDDVRANYKLYSMPGFILDTVSKRIIGVEY